MFNSFRVRQSRLAHPTVEIKRIHDAAIGSERLQPWRSESLIGRRAFRSCSRVGARQMAQPTNTTEAAKVAGLVVAAMTEPKFRQEFERHSASEGQNGERRGYAHVRGLAALALVSMALFIGNVKAQVVWGPPDSTVSGCTAVPCGSAPNQGPSPTFVYGCFSSGLVPIPQQRPGQLNASGQAVNGRTDCSTLGSSEAYIVGYQDNGFFTPYHAVRTTLSGGFTDLGTLGGDSSFATDVSCDGSVVVGFSDLSGGSFIQHAFRWTEADGMLDLGSANGANGFSRAFGISADGSVIVGESDVPGSLFVQRDPFVWTADRGFRDLGFVGSAYAITADGSVVVGQANYSTAFCWTQAGGMQDLGTLPGYTTSAATAVSDDGQVVVGTVAPRPLSRSNLGYDFDIDCRPFVWTATTGMQDLNVILANAGVDLTGVTLFSITGISADGKFVCGAGRTPENDPNSPNETSGFIAQLP
jgi:probable HAF family extracellular repeat protein